MTYPEGRRFFNRVQTSVQSRRINRYKNRNDLQFCNDLKVFCLNHLYRGVFFLKIIIFGDFLENHGLMTY